MEQIKEKPINKIGTFLSPKANRMTAQNAINQFCGLDIPDNAVIDFEVAKHIKISADIKRGEYTESLSYSLKPNKK